MRNAFNLPPEIRKSVKYLIAFAIVTAFFAYKGQAQCCGASYAGNEFGTRLVSFTDASTLGGKTIPAAKTQFGFLNGLHYKRYWSYAAFRVAMSYTNYEQEKTAACVDCNLEESGKVKGGYLRVGYEFIAVMNRIEPYAGFDLVGRIGSYKGVEEGTGSLTETHYLTDTRSSWGFGPSAFLGVRFFFLPGVSIGAETSLDALYTQTRFTRIQELPTTEVTRGLDSGFNLYYNPISNLSLNVMF
ncbi:MAG: hypothetical protein H6581_03580 [Bacteroidia bacterium]|nr:hypothetical protein [Bacteroidia bacterium]